MSASKNKPRSSTSRRRQRQEKQKKANQRRNAIYILIGAVAISAGLIYSSNRPIPDLVAPQERNHPLAEFNSMGKENAPVVIEEISDFQCTACLSFFNTVQPALINTGLIDAGLIRYVYRSAGNLLGPESGNAAEAAYCAGDQGKFWEMHDAIFANFSDQNTKGYFNSRLITIGDMIGLNGEALEECLDNHTYKAQLDQDNAYAKQVQIEDLPSLVINGVLYKGEMSFQAINFEIQRAMGAPGQ